MDFIQVSWRAAMINVFQIGGQVSGESFIGRKKIIKFIKESFIENKIRTSKSIVGLTRMGKTSVVRNSFTDLPDNVIYLYENLNEWSSYNEGWQIICLEIHEALEKLNKVNDWIFDCFVKMGNENQSWIEMIWTIKKIFAYLADINIKTILVLDEFDNASKLFIEGTKHFELFRTIFSDANYNVSAITISRKNLYTIEGTTYRGSTFHGVLDIVPFKGFDETDMEEYFNVFEKLNITLDESQKSRIVYYAGNAPYLLSIMGHYIIDTVNNSVGDIHIDIDKIFLNKCKSINDYYRDCIKHLKRDDDLKRIIPFVIGPNIGVTQIDKDELFNLGYFREEKGNLIAISEYFSEFLSAEMLQISIWDNVINLEKKLKQLIERELTRLVKKHSVGGTSTNEILKNLLQKVPDINQADLIKYDTFILNNKKLFNVDSSYLDVISMNDSIKIIKDCWIDIFSVYFFNDTYDKWKEKFDKCVLARNPLAHGHEEYLSNSDKQNVDSYCKQIFDTLVVTIKDVVPDSVSYLEAAKSFTILNPEIEYQEPDRNLIGTIMKMRVLEIGGVKNNNLKGVLDGKYRAVIPKNHLINKDLTSMINQYINVEVEKINNGQYEVIPYFK